MLGNDIYKSKRNCNVLYLECLKENEYKNALIKYTIYTLLVIGLIRVNYKLMKFHALNY